MSNNDIENEPPAPVNKVQARMILKKLDWSPPSRNAIIKCEMTNCDHLGNANLHCDHGCSHGTPAAGLSQQSLPPDVRENNGETDGGDRNANSQLYDGSAGPLLVAAILVAVALAVAARAVLVAAILVAVALAARVDSDGGRSKRSNVATTAWDKRSSGRCSRNRAGRSLCNSDRSIAASDRGSSSSVGRSACNSDRSSAGRILQGQVGQQMLGVNLPSHLRQQLGGLPAAKIEPTLTERPHAALTAPDAPALVAVIEPSRPAGRQPSPERVQVDSPGILSLQWLRISVSPRALEPRSLAAGDQKPRARSENSRKEMH